MPSSDHPPSEGAQEVPAPAQPTTKSQKQPNAQESAAADGKKLSGAELKKKAKEEKAARRAQALAGKQGGAPPAATLPSPVTQQKQEGSKSAQIPHKRTGSTATNVKNLPVRGAQKTVTPVPEEPKKEDKTVEYFRHLSKKRITSIAGVSKDVHPAVLSLGLQMSSYAICGSCARLVATLQVFKRVIETYTTPPGNSLTRHLTSHVLSPQIEYLSSCRPLSISMGNAIRWLKLEISKVDPDKPDTEAKKDLCESIDNFIRDKVTMADRVIAEQAAKRIQNGDVIMTFAKSSIVQKTLVKAHAQGKSFKVIIVDSNPLREGKHLAEALLTAGIGPVQYCLGDSFSQNIHSVTKVILGAHAMLSNGRLYSRIGTAYVASEAHEANIPVLVLCETIKFTERVALDSIGYNELAPADELVDPASALGDWRETKNMKLANAMYDVTPAEYLTMIVTESGNVPPTSVPVLHRLGNEGQG